MKKEQLLSMGVPDDKVDGILKIYKEAIDGNYIAKHRFDEINGELKAAKEQISERDAQIGELKKFEGDNKDLKAKIDELEKDNKNKDKDYQDKVKLERKKNAVRLALLSDEAGKPHDIDMVMGLIDMDKIDVDESGKITSGLKEQSESLRKDKAFLFDAKIDDKKKPGWKPTGTPPGDGNKGGGAVDPSISYGKSLAQIKLGMMGVKPAGADDSGK